MKKILIKNSLSGVIQLVLSSILIFITISIFNKNKGGEIYGIYATISLIGNLNLFTNLGINSALMIFLSEKGKCIESDHNIIVAFISILLIAIPTSILGLIFHDFILLKIFNIPQHYYKESNDLYIILVISNSISWCGVVLPAILDSMQKIYLTNFYQLIYNILSNILIILSILFSDGLKFIGLSILLSTIIWFTLLLFSVYRHWGNLNFTGIKNSFFTLFKKQTSFGFQIYISSLLNFFYEPLIKILISHLVGIKEVGFFDIALKIRNQIWGLVNKAIIPLLPLLSQLKSQDKIRDIIHDAEQKTFFLTIPIAIIIGFILKPLINIWIGKENSEIISITSLYVVCVYLMLSSPMIPMYLLLLAKKEATKTIYIQLVNVLINILALILFYKTFGYYAFLISYTLAIICSFSLMVYYQKKILESLIFDNYLQIVKLLIIVITLLSSGYLIKLIIPTDIMKLIFIPIILLFITLLLYRLLKLFKKEDLFRYFGRNNIFSFTLFKIFNFNSE